MPFNQPLDIVNRSCQLLGVQRITSLNPPDDTVQAAELNFAYDKLRLAELEGNLWRFATKRVILRSIGIDTVLWTPTAWVTATDYAAGAIVAYAPATGPYAGDTIYWYLSQAESPSSTTPDVDPYWHHYFGPRALDLYNTGSQGTGSSAAVNDSEDYQSGEVVLTPGIYVSGTTYAINNVVSYENGGVWEWYVSLVNSNTGNTPSSSPADWALWTSQGRGNGTYGVTATGSPIPLSYPGSTGVFVSLYNSNADNPLANTGTWLSLGGTIVPYKIMWPIGAGPNFDPQTLNVFRLPNGFLKRAPTDPKGGMFSWLGAASGSQPEDWVLEGEHIVSGDAGPIMMRFVADVIDVPDMDALFCEGLGSRSAYETCNRITQANDREQLCDKAYTRAINRARTTNAIEIGPITMPENRYVTVRR